MHSQFSTSYIPDLSSLNSPVALTIPSYLHSFSPRSLLSSRPPFLRNVSFSPRSPCFINPSQSAVGSSTPTPLSIQFPLFHPYFYLSKQCAALSTKWKGKKLGGKININRAKLKDRQLSDLTNSSEIILCRAHQQGPAGIDCLIWATWSASL